jgi:dolichol-phosphate mannosyltransferase
MRFDLTLQNDENQPKILNRLFRREEIARFLRFALVGLSGTLIDWGTLTALKTFGGFPTLLANSISYSLGIINNFIWSRAWVYRESRSGGAADQF